MVVDPQTSTPQSKIKKNISVLGPEDPNDEKIQGNVRRNPVSPLQFSIEADRIRKTLQEALAKLQVVFSLPAMIASKPKLLTDYLEKEQAELIMDIFQPPKHNSDEVPSEAVSAKSSEGSSFSGWEAEEKSDGKVKSIEAFEDIWQQEVIVPLELLKMADNLGEPGLPTQALEKGEIRKIASDTKTETKTNAKTRVEYEVPDFILIIDIVMKCKGFTEVLHDYEIEESSVEKSLIAAMQRLVKSTVEQFQTAKKMQKEKKIRTSYNFRSILDENISELENSHAKHRADFKAKEKEKLLSILEYKQKLSSLRQMQKNRQQKTVADSEGEIMRCVGESEEQQASLKLDAESSVQEYKILLQNNLKDEKELQNRLKKVEVQFSAWVNKYDTDMGERQGELDKLHDNMKNLNEEMSQLQDLLDDQEDVYLPLMKEKAEEERIQFEATLFAFVCNRSARIIQRTWRAYWARKLARKKKRKGKSKDKDTKAKGKKEKKVKEVREKKIKDPPPKTLEQKFGDDMFKEMQNDDSDAFKQNAGAVDLSAD